jgi:hypothetical protein
MIEHGNKRIRRSVLRQSLGKPPRANRDNQQTCQDEPTNIHHRLYTSARAGFGPRRDAGVLPQVCHEFLITTRLVMRLIIDRIGWED